MSCADAGSGTLDRAKFQQETQLRRLLVVNDDGRLVGIVYLGDLVLQTGDEKLAGQTLEKVSEPTEGAGR